MLKAYAIGFAGAALVVLLAVVISLALRPEEPDGLLWGGTVYETKAEFQGYLRQKGLNYETWLARNPGAAPWEKPAYRTTAAAREQAPETDDGLLSLPEWWPLAALAFAFAAVSALLLSRGAVRVPRPSLPRGALRPSGPRLDLHRDALTAGGRAALPPLRRAAVLASAVARRVEAAAPVYGGRLLAATRGDPLHVRRALRARNVGAGDVAFALLAVLASVMFGAFIVVLLSA